jgi:hypothetical protein
VQFEIVDADQILIFSKKHYLQEGDTTEVYLRLYNKNRTIDPSLYSESDLQLVPYSNFRLIRRGEDNSFIIRGEI